MLGPNLHMKKKNRVPPLGSKLDQMTFDLWVTISNYFYERCQTKRDV